ncbi:MAG: HU family DNA-binding protein [Prevotella sp.]|nr:HU family DNA-binding protein [Candidatus Equicola stercoris]
MNNKKFIKTLSKAVGKTQETAQDLVTAVFEIMADNFKKGEPVMISNFGLFEVKEKKARTIMNPETKQAMHVPEKSKLVFKPVVAMKEKINN